MLPGLVIESRKYYKSAGRALIAMGEGGGNCSVSDIINTLGGGPAVLKTKGLVFSKTPSLCRITIKPVIQG